MAQSFAHGAIQWAAESVGTIFTVSGLSFQPKALRFYMVGLQSATDAVSEILNLKKSIGFATSPTDRCSVAAADADAAGSMSTNSWWHTASVIRDNAAVGHLDLDSIQADGFKLIVDDSSTSGGTVFWEAWGGSDITIATTVQIAEPAAIGDQDYTVTGFVSGATDQVVMFAGVQATVSGIQTLDSGMCVGFATSGADADNVVVVGNNDEGSASADTDGYCKTGECLAMITVAGGNPNARAKLTQFGTDNFRLNWIARGVTDRRYIALAIKGGQWKAGSFTIAGNSTSATGGPSGLAFAPIGASLIGRMTAEQAAGTATTEDRIGFGSFTSTTDRRSQAYLSENGTGNAEIDLTIQYDQCLVYPDTAGGLLTAYDVTSMDSGGFTLIVDTAGGVASEWIGYLTFGSAGAVAPVLTADKVNYSLSGQTAGLLEAKRVTAAQTSYVLAGQLVVFAKGRMLTAAQTSYSLTVPATGLLEAKRIVAAQTAYTIAGQTAALAKGRLLTAAQRTYNLTGQAALLSKERFIVAAQISYVLTGRDAGLLEAKRIAANQTAYALTGTTTSFTKGRLLAAAQTSYSLTNPAANLLEAKRLTAAQTAYAMTAPATALLKGRQVTAALASYALTAQLATLLEAKRLTAAQVGYTFTGRDATLTVVEAATMAAGLASYSLTSPAAQLLKANRLTATQTSYSLAGQVAGLLEAKRVIAAATTYSLSAQAATLLEAKRVTAAQVSYTLGVQPADLLAAKRITAAQTAYSLTLQPATLLEAKRLTAAQTAYTLTGRDATLVKVSARTLTALPASYGLTSPAIELRQARRLTAVAQTYSLNGQTAELTKGRRLTAAQAAYTLTGRDATLIYVPSARLVAAVAAYSLTGSAVDFTWTQLFRLLAEVGYYGLVGQPVRLLTIVPAPPGGRPGYRRYARLPAQPASTIAAMAGNRITPLATSSLIRPGSNIMPAARSTVVPNTMRVRMPSRRTAQIRPPSGATLPPNRGAAIPLSPAGSTDAANQPPGEIL